MLNCEDGIGRKAEVEGDLWVLQDFFEDENRSNPLYAWEAIALCWEYQVDFPEWVIEYLGKVAKRLLNIAECKKSFGGRASEQVYWALGMCANHSRNVFDRYQIAQRDMEIATRVNRLRETMGLEEAFKKVVQQLAEEDIVPQCDKDRVKKAYYSITFGEPLSGRGRKKKGCS